MNYPIRGSRLYIFDLDGTLANIDHRLHYVKGSKKRDYDAFHRACVDDIPKQWVIDLLDLVRNAGEVLILSGRSSDVEVETREWLKKYGILYDYLIMRPSKNYVKDCILKKDMLENFLRDKDYKVQFIVDDRQSVVDMWRANGYNVLQCAKWEDSTHYEN